MTGSMGAKRLSSLQLQVQGEARPGALKWNLLLTTAARTAVLLLGTGLTAVGVHVAVCLQLGVVGMAGDIFMASAHPALQCPVLLVAGTALFMGGVGERLLSTTTLLSAVRSWCHVCKRVLGQLSRPHDLSLTLPGPRRCELGTCLPTHAATLSPLISDADLAKLMWRLRSGPFESGWESIVAKESDSVSYTACRRDPPGGGPTEYLSTTRYENCPVSVLLRFFLDSHFLAEWDKMVVSYCQLSLCHSSGVETGRFVKQYPFCSPREYLLTWRVWEGAEGDFYCFTKAANDSLVPRQRNLCRVESYEAMWRIRKVAGTSASQVTLFLSESNGMHREFAKCAFKRGVWAYIRRTDHHLRQYAKTGPLVSSRGQTALDFATKVPLSIPSYLDYDKPELKEGNCCVDGAGGGGEGGSHKSVVASSRVRKSSSRSNLRANMEFHNEARVNRGAQKGVKGGTMLSSLALIGGVVVLTRGVIPWGVKLVALRVLPLLGKR